MMFVEDIGPTVALEGESVGLDFSSRPDSSWVPSTRISSNSPRFNWETRSLSACTVVVIASQSRAEVRSRMKVFMVLRIMHTIPLLGVAVSFDFKKRTVMIVRDAA